MNFNELLVTHADFIRGFSAAILTVIIGSALVAVGTGFFRGTTKGFYDDESRAMDEHDRRMSKWESKDD